MQSSGDSRVHGYRHVATFYVLSDTGPGLPHHHRKVQASYGSWAVFLGALPVAGRTKIPSRQQKLVLASSVSLNPKNQICQGCWVVRPVLSCISTLPSTCHNSVAQEGSSLTQLLDSEKLHVSSLRNLFGDNAAVGGRLTKSSSVSPTQAQEIFRN